MAPFQAANAAAIRHHYDISDDFYRIVLGPAMTYSCARWELGQTSLEQAQRSKHDLICRKLGLQDRPHMRLLDVGCGWGGWWYTRPRRTAPGQWLSPSAPRRPCRPASRVRCRSPVGRRGSPAGLPGRPRRDLRRGFFHRHVRARWDQAHARVFDRLFSLLVPGGRLLNHAISKPGGKKMRGATFINRYVFPDGDPSTWRTSCARWSGPASRS